MPYTVENLKMMRPDELKSLLKNKKIDQTLNQDGYNLLHATVEVVARHKEFIPLVLAYDVDINAQDRRTGSYHNTDLMIGNKDGITAADLLTKEMYAAIKIAIEELAPPIVASALSYQ